MGPWLLLQFSIRLPNAFQLLLDESGEPIEMHCGLSYDPIVVVYLGRHYGCHFVGVPDSIGRRYDFYR
jgi:hypothetical protein